MLGSHTSLLRDGGQENGVRRWFLYASIGAFAGAERRVEPPRAGFLSLVAVNEAAQAHGGCQRQHDGVEAQPGEVDADLLPVVLPVKGDVPVSVRASK